MEVDAYLEIIGRLGYVNGAALSALNTEVHELDKMLTVLRSRLLARNDGGVGSWSLIPTNPTGAPA